MERKREQEKANERRTKNLVLKNEKEPSGSSYDINQVREHRRPLKGWKRLRVSIKSVGEGVVMIMTSSYHIRS